MTNMENWTDAERVGSVFLLGTRPSAAEHVILRSAEGRPRRRMANMGKSIGAGRGD